MIHTHFLPGVGLFGSLPLVFLFRFNFAVVWHTVEAVPDIPSHRIGIQLTIRDDGIAFRWKTDGGLPATLDDLGGSGLGVQMADGFACAISDDFFSDHFIHLAYFCMYVKILS